jgi:hypothetical protein
MFSLGTFYYRSRTKFFATFLHGKSSVLILAKNRLGFILGVFSPLVTLGPLQRRMNHKVHEIESRQSGSFFKKEQVFALW